MSFWSWALSVYARPDVAPACLRLQDNYDQNVPYLLWAAWAASTGRAVAPEVLAKGAALAHRWEQAAVAPLRQARRDMKQPVEGFPEATREALRAKVKALELEAEQALMTALEAMLLAPAADGAHAIQPALAAAAAAWRAPAPASALGRLAYALG